MRKVLYISGTRADYGPARRLLLEMDAMDEFELGVAVMGMHLDPAHGETWTEIEKDGLQIVDKVSGRLVGDSLSSMSESVGLYLYGFSSVVEKYDPDIVLVLGDRGEALAGAIAGAYLNKTVVHLCGGTLSGSVDDSIRHAITKFAHYHFPPFKDSADRIIQMGEDPRAVFTVGLPGGDLKKDIKYSKQYIIKKYNLNSEKPYVLLIQHSVTHSHKGTKFQISETLDAIVQGKYQTLIASPNDDAGGKVIKNCIKEYTRNHEHIQILPFINNRELFASIMAHAGVVAGNSSSGIVEAMSVGVPVVNIGDRQKGREVYSLLLNVSHNKDEITKAIHKSLYDRRYIKQVKNFSNTMTENNAEQLIIEKLKKLSLSKPNNSKQFFGVN